VSKVGLLIIDEIHLLGVDRGPVLEVLVSRMRFIASQTSRSIRFVGLSTALANARDLGDWLGIEADQANGALGLFNFRPSVRPVPMTIHIQGFPGKHYCPRMATMNKPAYAGKLLHMQMSPTALYICSFIQQSWSTRPQSPS
jgi:activating signal cointegrator complex subunit 3